MADNQDMTDEVRLQDVYRPRAIGKDRFEALSMPLEHGTIYGGQLMAQVLSVAAMTLPAPLMAHHMQTNFLTFGDGHAPLELQVSRVRDGKSTCHRQVEISQKGRSLLLASVSFQNPSPGFDHQLPLPDIASAEQLAKNTDNYIPFAAPDGDFPFLILDCNTAGVTREPIASIWARPREPIAQDALLHQMCFAFLSDATILQSAMQPHALDWEDPDLFVATMNHSIWFHRPLDINDWLLLHGQCPSTGAGRALSMANAFTSKGELFATVVQEGVLRRQKRESKA